MPQIRCQNICFLVRALFLVYRGLPSPYIVIWHRERSSVSCALLIRALIPFVKAPPHDLTTSQRPPLLTVTLEVRISTYAFGGRGTNTQSITPVFQRKSCSKMQKSFLSPVRSLTDFFPLISMVYFNL